MRVSLGHRRLGVISVTDLHDVWVDNALSGCVKGAYVRALVLGSEALGAKAKPGKKAEAEEAAGKEEMEEEEGEGKAAKDGAEGDEPLRLSARPSHGGIVAGMKQSTLSSAATAAEPAKKLAKGQVGRKRSAPEPASATTNAAGVDKSVDGSVGRGPAPEVLSDEALAVGSRVCGYVKRVTDKGLFLALDRSRVARIKIAKLSDG